MTSNSMNILLIGDNLEYAGIIHELQEDEHFHFNLKYADSLSSGLKMLKDEQYLLVLLDLNLHEYQGIETYRRFKDGNDSIPIVILTSLDDEFISIQAIQEGAQDYLVKGEIDGFSIERSIRYCLERKRTEDALRESEKKYRRLVETLQEGIWQIDKCGCTTFVNPRMAKMLGYTVEEMIGKSLFFFMDENMRNAAQSCLRRRQQGIKEQHDFEFKRKDGSNIYATLETGPILDTHGNYSGALAGVMDITERKRSEDLIKKSLAEKDLMLKEINHRVKNNLQIISSLLYLQSTSFEDKKILEAFAHAQNRIKTISLIHENLYMSKNLGRVDFTDYLKQLVTQISTSHEEASKRVTFKVNLCDAFLDIDTAMPCGLLVNELLTNSMKHAFPGDMSGEISLELELESDGVFKMVVADNGVGFCDDIFLNTKTLGLQLVNALLSQIDAEFSLYTANGARYEIRFKERK